MNRVNKCNRVNTYRAHNPSRVLDRGSWSTTGSSFVSVVAVSVPKISVEGRAVLGRPVKILCGSDSGSLPINYTLMKGYDQVDTVVVKLPWERAVFTVTTSSAADMGQFMCEARNGPKEPPLSRRLNLTVVG